MENTAMENHSKTLKGPAYSSETSRIVSSATARTLRIIRDIMKMLKLRLKNLAYPLLHGLFLFDEPGSGLSHYIDNRLINLNPNGQNIDTGLIHVSERKARIK